jgi:hypothetical protein
VKIDISSPDLAKTTARLRQLHYKHLPIAVRNTLNKVGNEMKTKTLQENFDKNFTVRRDTFLKSQTGYTQVPFNEWKISRMKYEAGIMDTGKLVQKQILRQEFGGDVPDNRYVPTDNVRKGRNGTINRRDSFKHYKALNSGHTPSQKGVKVKNRKFYTILKTKNAVYRIDRGGKFKTLYQVAGSAAKIKKKPFIEPAGRQAWRVAAKEYRAQLEKALKK